MTDTLKTDSLAMTTDLLEDTDWSMTIEAQRRLFDLRLSELWQYRDLVMLFVRRDFVAVYR